MTKKSKKKTNIKPNRNKSSNKTLSQKNKNQKIKNNINKEILLAILLLFTCILITVLIVKNNKNNNKINHLEKELTIANNKIQEQNKKINNCNEIINPNKSLNNVKIENPATKIPILTFHRIVDSESKEKYFKDNKWVNDLEVTDNELKYLYNNGWKTIDLDEFYCWYNKDCEFPEKTFVITIDDGDSEAYYNLLPILKRYNFKATMFAIGSLIPDVTENLEEPIQKKLGMDKIKELRNTNSLLQVESHTYNLHYTKDGQKAVQTKTEEELKEDFENGEKYNFKYLAYPYGKYTKNMLNVVSNTKIKLAFLFHNYDYARRTDGKYEIQRLKVDGWMSVEEFKKIFDYAK